MIKRLIIAIIFMIAAISLSVTGYFTAKHEINKICFLLEDVIYAEDTVGEEELFNKANYIMKKWPESNKILAIFIRHNLTIETQQRMQYIQNCINTKNKEELIIACYNAHSQLISVLQAEKPSLTNTL